MATVECIGCAEQIQETALLCKNCGTRQDDSDIRDLRDARRFWIEQAIFHYERDEDGDLADIQRLFSLINRAFVDLDVYGVEMAWDPEGRRLEFEYDYELFFLELQPDNTWISKTFWLGQHVAWDDDYRNLMHPLTPRALAVIAICGLSYQMKLSLFMEENLNERLVAEGLEETYIPSQERLFKENLEQIDRTFAENDRKFWRELEGLILLESEIEALLTIQEFARDSSIKRVDEMCTEGNRDLWVNFFLAITDRDPDRDSETEKAF